MAMVVVLLLVAGELFLPWVVARGIETGLLRALGQGEALEVSLGVRPALRLLTGRIDTLTVTSRRVQTATLSIDSLAVTVSNIGINMQALLHGACPSPAMPRSAP